MKRLNQSGSHIIGLALLVLALGVVGFAGYKVEQAHNKSDTTAQTAANKPVAAPTTIANTADLQQASSALDSSSSQLNSNLDDSSLNADLDSML